MEFLLNYHALNVKLTKDSRQQIIELHVQSVR